MPRHLTPHRRTELLTSEVAHEIAFLVIAVAQMAACCGYFTTASEEWFTGAGVLLTVACAAQTVLVVDGVRESCKAQRASSKNKVDAADHQTGEQELELIENVCNIVGSLLFGIGAVLFLPQLTAEALPAAAARILAAGTSCFLIGSFLFFMASFCNSLTIAVSRNVFHLTREKWLAVAALGCQMLGSLSFVSGSFWYFPAATAPVCSSPAEWNAVNVGTVQYVFGSFMFVLCSAKAVYLAIHKHSRDEVKASQGAASLHPEIEAANPMASN